MSAASYKATVRRYFEEALDKRNLVCLKGRVGDRLNRP